MSLLLMALTTIGIGFFLIVSPKQGDDYWFSLPMKSWFTENNIDISECGWEVFRTGFPIQGIINTWVEHIKMDCGRLANLTMMFFLALPKWFGSSIAFGFWILCMVISLRLAKVSMQRSPWLLAVALFCWSFQIAWSENLGSLALQYNYIVPSGLMVWYIWWLYNSKYSRWNMILVAVLGLIIGAWHEGFSVPVFIGGISIILFYRQFRMPKYYLALISLLLGIIFLISCPGFYVRIECQLHILDAPLIVVVNLFLANIIYFIMFVWIIIRLIRGGLKNLSPLLMFALISGGTAVFIHLFAGGYRRISWWADVISIIGLLELFGTLKFNKLPTRSWLKWSIFIILGSLTLVHWGYVDYYTFNLRKEFKEAISKIKASSGRFIFLDYTPSDKMPLICMRTPGSAMFDQYMPAGLVKEYFTGHSKEYLMLIVPEILSSVTAESGSAIPGGTGLREINGYIFGEKSLINFKKPAQEDRCMADMLMSTGLKGEVMLIAFPFISEKDCKEYLYIRPVDINFKVLVGKIEELGNLRPCWGAEDK